MIDAQDLWKNIAKILKMQISDTDFNTFFFTIEANKIEEKTLLLNIESNLLKTNIESKYKEKIEELLKILSNDMITNFEFNIKKEDVKFIQKDEVWLLPTNTEQQAIIPYTIIYFTSGGTNFILNLN